MYDSTVKQVLRELVPVNDSEMLLAGLAMPESLLEREGETLNRAQLALLLSLMLFHDLTERVRLARFCLLEVMARGEKVFFDHGAARTVLLDGMGNLPAGKASLLRLLEPLGWGPGQVYPLPGISMTGYSFTQGDYPEELPQFFISEFHPEKFSPAFGEAVKRVVSTSSDPLSEKGVGLLQKLTEQSYLSKEEAMVLLPELAGCFSCRHSTARLTDYAILKAESAEMAWIATEGNTFNHIAVRVKNLDKVVEEQKAKGRPLKENIEVSQSGRIRQTAFRAANVTRGFVMSDGSYKEQEVPGSFYEFIERAKIDAKKLDLGFDSGNAQGIFQMTAGQSEDKGKVMLAEQPHDF